MYSSDLRRAVQTVEIAFAGSPVPRFADRRLRECCYGVLDGAPVEEVAAVRASHVDTPFPGGQSYREVVGLTRELLRDLAAAWDGGRVLLVAHSANRWALDVLLNGADLATLVAAPFEWREGWEHVLPDGWDG